MTKLISTSLRCEIGLVSRPLVSCRHAYATATNRTDLFALVPQLGLRFEPQLEQLDRLLDDDEIFDRVRDDLARRHPRTRSRGRPSTPVEVILRMLVVMRLYGWSYEQAEYFVNDSLVLRQFCRVYLETCPRRHHADPLGQHDRPGDPPSGSTTGWSSWPGR